MLSKIVFSFIILLSWSQAGNWKADPSKASIKFKVEGIFGMVNGHFSGLKSTIHFDENDLAGSSFTASIDPKTVSTGISLRNADLRNKEVWFNTDKYPLISFKSKQIQKTSGGYKVSGELTIKATTKPVKISFRFSTNGNTGLFKGEFVIKRMDYDLGNEGGSVGSEVTIILEVPVEK